MRIFFTRRNIVILAAAVLIAVISIVSLNTDNGPGLVTDGLNAVTNPLKRAAASVARTFESIYGYMYEYEAVVRENEDLKRQISDLQQKYRESSDIAAENERLHELLRLSGRRPDFSFEDAAIIQWSASNWTSSFLINKGSDNSEIQSGDAVISETGVLIGRVSEVNAVSSVCVSVVDTTFYADALIGEVGASGNARGDFSLMGGGYLKLTFISEDAAIAAGDTVVTSGRGIFPGDLVIGSVVSVKPDNTGLGVSAVIRPAAELNQATFVYVVTDYSMGA